MDHDWAYVAAGYGLTAVVVARVRRVARAPACGATRSLAPAELPDAP